MNFNAVRPLKSILYAVSFCLLCPVAFGATARQAQSSSQARTAAPEWLCAAAQQIQHATDENAYCYAVASLIDQLQAQFPKSYWAGEIKYSNLVLRFPGRKQDHRLWDPSFFDVYFAASSIESDELRTNFMQAGHGLPLVGWRQESPERRQIDPFFPPCGLPGAATAVAEVKQLSNGTPELTLRFFDPAYPVPGIATNLTAPLAFLLNVTKKPSSILGFMHPADFAGQSGLFMIEPYRHDKIPVVLVHGLNSLPRTWSDVCNELRIDPALRERYQFWLFRYPTGVPVPMSAAMLRGALTNIREVYDPKHKDSQFDQMVLVGHSMGGMVSRMMVTESGDNFWNSISDKPFEQAVLSAEDRAALKASFFFHAQPSVKRVVFIATPHRGSNVAATAIGNMARRLVQLPSEVSQLPARLTAVNPGILREGIGEFPTSIDNLRPNNRFVRLLQQMPIHAPHHSIIGDRGANVREGGSDGIVPYWSSHLDTAQSEVIVPAKHSAHHHPAAVAELGRILREHLCTFSPAKNTRASAQKVRARAY